MAITKEQKIWSYRKKHACVRHEYLTLATKYSGLSKSMFTFTIGGRGTYSRLRLINEVKTYVTYLIANSNAEIYFFSNIEIGHALTNPHLHTQLWCDDKNALRAIYEKVIEKFSLVKKNCSFSKPQQKHDFYTYLIKDYAKDLTDEQVWKLEQTKKKYRKQLGLKLRFYSRSKSKYQSRLYKIMYRYYGVLREFADAFLDKFFSLFFRKERIFKAPISSFITIKNKACEESCLENSFWTFRLVLEILFYSPSNDPPLFSLRTCFCPWF